MLIVQSHVAIVRLSLLLLATRCVEFGSSPYVKVRKYQLVLSSGVSLHLNCASQVLLHSSVLSGHPLTFQGNSSVHFFFYV